MSTTVRERRWWKTMDKTRLTFCRGTKGMGVVIAVSCGKDRIVFDFGAPFDPKNEVYDKTVRRRTRHAAFDSLILSMIPPLPGVFSKESLYGRDLQPFEDSGLNTAVFICHLHLDHMSEIDKVDPHIPVYIHEEGLKLLSCLQKAGKEPLRREFSAFSYHETIHIGKIAVTPFFSDHPCPGSASFLIETEDQTILYSGDIRFHGCQSERAFQEASVLAGKKIDLLIVDATTTSPAEFSFDEKLQEACRTPSRELLEGSVSEASIYEDIVKTLKNQSCAAAFNQYERDTEMMERMCETAEKLRRTIVFEPMYAYILYMMKGIRTVVLEEADDGLYEEIASLPRVSLSEISDNKGNYLLQNSFENILDLSHLGSGHYFHLFGEPLTDRDPDYQLMRSLLNETGWSFHSYANLYSFSHSYPNQLAYYIGQINAKSVVAVHSRHPEKLNSMNSRQFFPEEGREYVLEEGILK